MQSKSLVLFFVIAVILPIIALSSNHELFFAVMSLFLLIVAFRYIFRYLTGENLADTETDEDAEEELEDLTGIDVKKLGTGLSVASNLLTILFLCYCAFFLDAIPLKIIAALAIILQVHFIIKKAGRDAAIYNPNQIKPQILLSSVLNIAIIIITLVNKLFRFH